MGDDDLIFEDELDDGDDGDGDDGDVPDETCPECGLPWDECECEEDFGEEADEEEE
jgi:hypothetical protein